MKDENEVKVDLDKNEIDVQISLRDEDLANYLAEFDSDEERLKAAERAFRVGALTLQLSETTKDVEHVKREFNSMQTELEREIEEVTEELNEKFGDEGELGKVLEEHLGEEGTLRERIEEAFGENGEMLECLNSIVGEDGSKIQEAFDPDTEGTPFYRLKREIQELRDKIERESGREEERQKSWKKGTEFEETVGNILDSLAYNTTHEVEHVGDEEGEIPGRDVGDHVITLGETGQRIVFESKSEKGYSSQDIKEEMEEALENRDAEYGIFVTECESYVPDKVGYFQEYDQEILSIALSADEDDEIDEGFLHIAWNWARMRTIQSSMKTRETIDTETIQSQVEEIRSDIERFSTVKTKCSNIEDTAGDIKRLLDEIRDDIHTDLQEITTELSKEGESTTK